MERTLGELAALIEGEVRGDAGRVIRNLAPVDEAGPGDLTFVDQPAYHDALISGTAGAAIVSEPVEGATCDQIVATDPRRAFFTLAALLSRMDRPEPGVHGRAFVDDTASVDPGATVYPLAYVGPGAKVGAGTVLHAGCVLVGDCTIGADCEIHAGACVGPKVAIGDRVILHFNASIGADGFGYMQRGGVNVKVPQLGGVRIGNDVEVGACSTIDRGTLGDTVVDEGAKIDNLVQVAHNCKVGAHAILVAHAGMGGSSEIGDHAMLGPHAGLIDHVKVGSGAKVGGMSGIAKDVAPGAVVFGAPAMEHRTWMRTVAHLPKLADMAKRIRELEGRLAALEGKADDGGEG